MASDWNDELDKYENGRSFGEDLRDSVRSVFSAASLIASKLPDSENTASVSDKEFRKNRPWLWYSWEKKEDFD
ncbi:hypothetical protein [Pantoea ananatis]|uniref:hypothetical protein n=1 Tax=Pantoea ananas TaxID=553 RepID=UPI000E280B79|nr:hypothetical protein [Pantoea ananatis]REC88955.1 hypothetical protein C7423_11612 [Pantoea ananatis]